MLAFSFAILSLTVILGACLVAGRLYRAAFVHGGSGAAGLLLFLWVLKAGGIGGPFAIDAAVLLAAALGGGVTLWALSRSGRGRPALVVFLHASAGGVAYLLLAGFLFGK